MEKELVENYLAQEAAVTEIESSLKDAKAELEACRRELIDYLSNNGMTRTGSYDGLGSISLRNFNTYKVSEENKAAAFQFLKDNNYEGVIKETIHHKTFDKVCNELVESGTALPDFVEAYNVSTLQINKG